MPLLLTSSAGYLAQKSELYFVDHSLVCVIPSSEGQQQKEKVNELPIKCG